MSYGQENRAFASKLGVPGDVFFGVVEDRDADIYLGLVATRDSDLVCLGWNLLEHLRVGGIQRVRGTDLDVDTKRWRTCFTILRPPRLASPSSTGSAACS